LCPFAYFTQDFGIPEVLCVSAPKAPHGGYTMLGSLVAALVFCVVAIFWEGVAGAPGFRTARCWQRLRMRFFFKTSPSDSS
jgi:hypothetical protein